MLTLSYILGGIVAAFFMWRRRRFSKDRLINVTEGRTRPERGGF